jgi:uncharacterized membrane protein YozB (DUF420 family)
MLYIDLILSFILFAMGIILIIRKRLRSNRWLIVLAFLFFPVALVTYYFPELDLTVFGNTSIVKIVIYPFIKIIILLAFIRYIFFSRNTRA